MSEAPERIWAGNWLADVGETVTWDMGEWRNEPWPTVDVVEYVRADRIEELEAKLAEEIRISNKRGNVIEFDLLPKLHDTEAKLAKAAVALERLSTAEVHGGGEVAGIRLSEDPMGREILARMDYARTTIAELKGELND